MSIEINNYEDHRNVTVPAGTIVKVTFNGNEVYSHTVSDNKKANVAFQLQEVNE